MDLLPTTFITSERLSERLGVSVTLASEAHQHTGSFKARAAMHVVRFAPQSRFITASSGNFGQALAYACRVNGKQCTVVMPETAARVKIDAVRSLGGTVELIDTATISRAERVRQLSEADPQAYVTSAYDDSLVILGNASLGAEIAGYRTRNGGAAFDAVVVPVGGGGLAAGVVTGLRCAQRDIPVIGAEPLMANDAARSFREGRIVSNDGEPQTIADGARTVSIGEHNWAVLHDELHSIVEVEEGKISEAVRLLFLLANVKAEPTGALAVAAVLQEPERFQGRHMCCVVSGGNVDPGVYARILRGEF